MKLLKEVQNSTIELSLERVWMVRGIGQRADWSITAILLELDTDGHKLSLKLQERREKTRQKNFNNDLKTEKSPDNCGD